MTIAVRLGKMELLEHKNYTTTITSSTSCVERFIIEYCPEIRTQKVRVALRDLAYREEAVRISAVTASYCATDLCSDTDVYRYSLLVWEQQAKNTYADIPIVKHECHNYDDTGCCRLMFDVHFNAMW